MLPGVQDKKVDFLCFKEKILPVAACFATSLIFSNISYVYLSVSFIQMLKATTPIAVLLFSFALGLGATVIHIVIHHLKCYYQPHMQKILPGLRSTS